MILKAPRRINKKSHQVITRKAIKLIFFFQYRNFDRRNQGNNESCKVTTIVNTNHFPQNLKKQYRFSLAIVVFQSGSHLHSGDRLFERPKLSGKKWERKALMVKFTIAYVREHAFCGVHKYSIILLDGRVLFVSYLPFNNYSTISTILQGFFNVKLMNNRVVLEGLNCENSIRSSNRFVGEL